MTEIQISKADSLKKDQILIINKLTEDTWPETILTDQSEDHILDTFMARNPGKHCHMIWQEGKLLAYAESFPRRVKVGQDLQTIMGLGAVCVSKSARGLGLGADIVKSCLSRIDDGEFQWSLFQTMVPDFYEKLNCKIIGNRIFNSINTNDPKKNPFWDDYIIAYPKSYILDNQDIDLLGQGY